MKKEVKEAVEFLNMILNWPLKSIETTEDNIGKAREVISLLQELEKYREMWEEIEKYEYPSDLDFSRVEQKYFTHLQCKDCATDEVELTKEEKEDIKGDMEAHRIMVEGRDIE